MTTLALWRAIVLSVCILFLNTILQDRGVTFASGGPFRILNVLALISDFNLKRKPAYYSCGLSRIAYKTVITSGSGWLRNSPCSSFSFTSATSIAFAIFTMVLLNSVLLTVDFVTVDFNLDLSS